MNVFTNFRLVNLELNKKYILANNKGWVVECELIKSTEKGYNLLNLKTNKLMYHNHLYPSKYRSDGMWFFISKYININEINIMKEEKKHVQPPIGVCDRNIHERNVNLQRLNDLSGAIARYYTAGLKIDVKWVEEYNELIEKTQ